MGFDDVAVLELKGWKSDADFNNLFPTGAKSEIFPIYLYRNMELASIVIVELSFCLVFQLELKFFISIFIFFWKVNKNYN